MTEESCFLFCDAPCGLPAPYTGILAGQFWGVQGLESQPGQELTQLEAKGLREPMEHTAWLPEGCLPKGQPSEEGAESALARGNFIFTLQELEGLPLSFKVLSQRCLWGSRPLKEPEPLIYFVGWSLKPSIGGKRWRCADREGR